MAGGTAPVLRPYQDDVIGRVYQHIESGHRRLIIVAPTGAGKTVIGSKMVHDTVQAGKRVLFIVHRRELIHQTSQKLFSMGVDAGIIAAGFNPRPLVPVQIAGVQSLYVRATLLPPWEMLHIF
jgi:superfamily II DNA or RNA helicase